jgi:hypothetical protein
MEDREMKVSRIMVNVFAMFVIVCGVFPAAAAETFIVKDGQANAEIIIADSPARMTRLAAKELQDYIRKISGAALAVTNTPGAAPVKIFVGKSAHTDRLGIKPYDTKDGGYRIVSGDKWLALIGRDDDFIPVEPFPKSRQDLTDGSVIGKWDKLTGDAKWGYPVGSMFKSKNYFELAPCAVVSTNEQRNKDGSVLAWSFDERGSFNAVCGFLRSLGVRWYMPGELGEVVPEMKSIPLPEIDETVRSAFPLRQFSVRFGVQGRDVALWAMRMGLRDDYGTMIAHGIALFTGRKEFGEMHPDYFALYGGKRENRRDDSKRQLCLSSEELLKENVNFARAVFDIYKFDVVSIMPPDGYSAICQCKLCAGKDAIERGSRGMLSDYVWDYVNRAAKETAKTHPDKKILCCAYGAYTLPPFKIDKLNPNVIVCIVGGRRPTANKPEQQEEFRQLREEWRKKTDNKIMIFENYPLTSRGYCQPSYCAHAQGEINATKPYSMGEDIWFTPGKDFHVPGYNHFNLYFTARMYWENDVDALYNEYCRLFYGPAEKEMKAFFDYCEANHQEMNDDFDKAKRALDLFAAAEKKADAGSVYGKRIALVADYLKGFKAKAEELAQPREDKMALRVCDKAAGIKIDGKLDEKFWQDIPADAVGRLADLVTGSNPVYKTSCKAGWEGANLYFGIHCEDSGALNNGATRNEDPAIWFGDAVEIILETDKHAYYQFAINPAGMMMDLDRAAGKLGYQWNSQAEVAVVAGEAGWTIEIRIPITTDENDPLHQVIGTKPDEKKPWHFNVCRQRLRDKESELTAFSPTGKKGFHFPRKFGRLFVK